MIAALVCLLFPAAGRCPQYVERVPPISAVVAEKSAYDAQEIHLFGRVRSLEQWTSKKGPYRYEAFSVCDGRACVRVFMETFSPIRDGELVSVRGAYYADFRINDKSYPNEIEATEITPH
jgi:hypothetical protein